MIGCLGHGQEDARCQLAVARSCGRRAAVPAAPGRGIATAVTGCCPHRPSRGPPGGQVTGPGLRDGGWCAEASEYAGGRVAVIMGGVMPPRCRVCGRDVNDLPAGQELLSYFALVYFALDEQERVEQTRRDAIGVTGHPLGALWFCREHAGPAQARAGLHWRTALAEITAEAAQE